MADVFTFAQLAADDDNQRPCIGLFRNSFFGDRSPDFMVNFNEGVLVTSSTEGTSHGTPYRYDTDVPIVLYGPNFGAGTNRDSVRTVDIAPTVAAILHIKPAAGVDGHPLPIKK